MLDDDSIWNQPPISIEAYSLDHSRTMVYPSSNISCSIRAKIHSQQCLHRAETTRIRQIQSFKFKENLSHNAIIKLCKCEAQAFLNAAFNSLNQYMEPGSDSYKRLHEDYVKGVFTPQVPDVNRERHIFGSHNLLIPQHPLEIEHYLHFQSDDFLKDLSNAFSTEITDSYIRDPNSIFNDLLNSLQQSMSICFEPFYPTNIIPLPCNIAVIGPPGGGKTTIVQMITHVFDATVIEVIHSSESHRSGSKRKSGRGQRSKTPKSKDEEEDSPEPSLPFSHAISYTNEKNVISKIEEIILSSPSSTGFILVNFPSTKQELAALDKTLSQTLMSLSTSEPLCSTKSISSRSTSSKSRGKASKTSPSFLQGIIFALNSERGERLVDPQTGFRYSSSFNMPSFSDVIGINPIDFSSTIEEINQRLIPLPISETIPKFTVNLMQFEAQLKKSGFNTLKLYHCAFFSDMANQLDSFLTTIFPEKSLSHSGTHQRKIVTEILDLVRPQKLLLPVFCEAAVRTWKRSLKSFGKIIADQANLVSTLGQKIDFLVRGARIRFQLTIARTDKRSELVKQNPDFVTIWNESLTVRDSQFKKIDSVIAKSGLIELLIELRKSPKIVFLALVSRASYLRWFYKSHNHIDCKNSYFDTMKIDDEEIAIFDFRDAQPISKRQALVNYRLSFPSLGNCNVIPPRYRPRKATLIAQNLSELNAQSLSSQKSYSPNDFSKATNQITLTIPRPTIIKGFESLKPLNKNEYIGPLSARNNRKSHQITENQKEVHDFKYLMNKIEGVRLIPQEPIYFDVGAACASLEIPFFETNTSFDNTVEYAQEFFSYVGKRTQLPLLKEEAECSIQIFNKFAESCQKKEHLIVEAVLSLHDELMLYVYHKSAREMESFAKRFRAGKGANDFEYDQEEIDEITKKLISMSLLFSQETVTRDVISFSTILDIAKAVVETKRIIWNIDDFMSFIKSLPRFIEHDEDDELKRIELSLRVMECVECFDARKFFKLFLSTKEEEFSLKNILRSVGYPK